MGMGTLQWGRDLSVAETWVCVEVELRIGSASMGPRPFSRRDIAQSLGVSESNLSLQWGRDLSVAETRTLLSPISLPGPGFNGAATFQSQRQFTLGGLSWEWERFNGAATFQSQRPGYASRLNFVSAVLQWGRDLSVAETAWTLRHNFRDSGASMGPRPFSRRDCAS